MGTRGGMRFTLFMELMPPKYPPTTLFVKSPGLRSLRASSMASSMRFGLVGVGPKALEQMEITCEIAVGVAVGTAAEIREA